MHVWTSGSRLHCQRRRVCLNASGKCWLVGSGPGSLELMTVQSLLSSYGMLTVIGCPVVLDVARTLVHCYRVLWQA